jgi:C4-dicarboxylate-specific signal transduction histidine kinase
MQERWQRFNVKDALQKAVAMMDANFETIGVNVRVDIKDDAFAEGYPNEFTQVLLSILHNAKESLSDNGRDKKVAVALDRPDAKTVRIEIRDTGGGIDQENIDRIFEPYFTTKFKAMGVGASLYMAKMAVEKRMFGTIEAVNRNGGAVFIIKLPAHEEFGGYSARAK